MAEEKKLEVFPIGITAKEIVKVVEEAGISGGATEITADNIDSGTATNGQVLAANGLGGAAWVNASGGGSADLPFIVIEESGSDTTIQDILDAHPEIEVPAAFSANNYNVFFKNYSSGVEPSIQRGYALLSYNNFGFASITISQVNRFGYVSLNYGGDFSLTLDSAPTKSYNPFGANVSELEAGSTYTLKWHDGQILWSKDVGQ